MKAGSLTERSGKRTCRQESSMDTSAVSSKLHGDLANLWNNAVMRSEDEFREVEVKRAAWQHRTSSQIEEVLNCVIDIKQGFQGLQQEMQTINQVDAADFVPQFRGSAGESASPRTPRTPRAPPPDVSEALFQDMIKKCEMSLGQRSEMSQALFEDMMKRVETSLDERLDDMRERLELVSNIHETHILRLDELVRGTAAHRETTERLEAMLVGQQACTQPATAALCASNLRDIQAETQAAGDPLVEFHKVSNNPCPTALGAKVENNTCLTTCGAKVEDDPSSTARCANVNHDSNLTANDAKVAFSRLHSYTVDLDLDKHGVVSHDEHLQNHLRWVQRVSFALIVMNTIYMGIVLDVFMRRHLHGNTEGAVYYEMGDFFFTGAFILEIVLRLSLERRAFFCGQNVFWNMFDSVIVLFQAWQAFQGSLGTLAFLRVGRFARLARTARMLRTIQHLRIFRIIANPEVWQPVLTGFASLICFLYFGALVVTSGVAYAIEERGPEGLPEGLVHHYGSVGKTMVTLFIASMGGESWGELSKPLHEASAWLKWALLFFIFSMIFGLMNTVVAMYVDAFTYYSNLDRLMNGKNAADRALLKRLRDMLLCKPLRAGNVIRYGDVHEVLSNEGAAVLKKLRIEIGIAQALFKLLDGDDRGTVEVDEFIHSLLNLKGGAQNLYLATTQKQCKSLIRKVNRLTTLAEEQQMLIAALLGGRKDDDDLTSERISVV